MTITHHKGFELTLLGVIGALFLRPHRHTCCRWPPFGQSIKAGPVELKRGGWPRHIFGHLKREFYGSALRSARRTP